MLIVRNLAILAVIALAVTVLPGGKDATDTVLTAIQMLFLASLAYFAWYAHKENPMAVASLSERWRAVHWGALGVLAFLVAGSDEMFNTGAGTLLWLALLVGSILALLRGFQEANSY
jgi:membrane protease YdiL (CAAX protease family)